MSSNKSSSGCDCLVVSVVGLGTRSAVKPEPFLRTVPLMWQWELTPPCHQPASSHSGFIQTLTRRHTNVNTHARPPCRKTHKLYMFPPHTHIQCLFSSAATLHATYGHVSTSDTHTCRQTQ